MEPKKSRSRESCCGMAVEKCCFIFAVINAIVASLSVLVCLGFMGLMVQGYLEQGFTSHVLFFTILIAVCCVGAAVALTFAALLCVGLSKKNPRYVMAYLVYGMLTEVASVAGILAFIVMQWEERSLVAYSYIFLLVCVIYAFVLWLVYRTYAVLADSPPTQYSSLFDRRKLPQHEYEC